MARKTKADAVAAAEPILHFAARVDDSYREFREKRARKRGLVVTVVPYAGYGGRGWVRVLGRVVLKRPTDSDLASASVRGWRSFTSVPVNDVTVTVRIGDREQQVKTDRGGVLDARLESDLPPGINTITLQAQDSEIVEATVHIVDAAVTFGIVSDIDDTVMVTALPRPFLAAWNTFVLDEHARSPVPGMAVLYERLTLEHPGAPVIYLSTGAWNVAPTLSRFLSRNLYPAGPLLLTDWGPTTDRWFRSGTDHKRATLARLAEEFPDVRWLLIGDDGQHDEQTYGHFLDTNQDNVHAVAIRQLSAGEAVLAGGRSTVEDLDAAARGIPWLYAPDGAGLAEQLKATDLL
jgi:phosphatidate phosphatase APP1